MKKRTQDEDNVEEVMFASCWTLPLSWFFRIFIYLIHLSLTVQYRIPDAYDQDGGVDQEKRFAVAVQRYR